MPFGIPRTLSPILLAPMLSWNIPSQHSSHFSHFNHSSVGYYTHPIFLLLWCKWSVGSAVAEMHLCVCLSTSREHRRYFYVNDRTNASQWDFPIVEDEEEGNNTANTNSQQDGAVLTNSTSALAGTDQIGAHSSHLVWLSC